MSKEKTADLEEKVEKEEEVKTEEEAIRGINVLTVSVPESPLKKALDILFTNSFGNQANKKIYALQKELGAHIDEYNHLRAQLTKDPKNVDGDKFSEKGMVELLNLNRTIGSKEIEFKVELPIKVKFLDCFSSNDRIILEVMRIAEFED